MTPKMKNSFLYHSGRPGSNSEILEIVAGTLDKENEDAREAMIREIDEEIGYKTDKITLIDECYMSPGGSTEKISIYYCEVSEKIHQGGGLAART
jgi:ADP-ribose pyrophosphatase